MPNLFDYATKELSQDAVICWLIAWSQTNTDDKHNRMLRKLGTTFVDKLLAKHVKTLSWKDVQRLECSEKAEIYQQETVVIDRKRHSMDVLACISDKDARHVLLIEDKIDGDGDVDQLNRYYEILTTGRKTKSGQTKTTQLGLVPKDQVQAIYLDTGNHSSANTQRIEQCTEFKVFSRNDFLEVLETYQGDHPVVKDFQSRLQRWEHETTSFPKWTRDEDRKYWPWSAWQGLYLHLERKIDVVGWGYIPRGDFLGLWWHYVNFASPKAKHLYLQLEVKPRNPSYQKLCFKIEAGKNTDNDQKRKIRDECLEAVLEIGEPRVARPRHLGMGKTMTVAVWAGDWLEFSDEGSLDIEGTVANLNQAQEIVDVASLRL